MINYMTWTTLRPHQVNTILSTKSTRQKTANPGSLIVCLSLQNGSITESKTDANTCSKFYHLTSTLLLKRKVRRGLLLVSIGGTMMWECTAAWFAPNACFCMSTSIKTNLVFQHSGPVLKTLWDLKTIILRCLKLQMLFKTQLCRVKPQLSAFVAHM